MGVPEWLSPVMHNYERARMALLYIEWLITSVCTSRPEISLLLFTILACQNGLVHNHESVPEWLNVIVL